MRVWYTGFKYKIIGSHTKKTCLVHDFWVRIEIPTWILCGSHAKFEFSLSPVFESNPNSNLDWIHVGPSLLPLLATRFFFLPFSLSLLHKLFCFSLSCSRLITEPVHRPFFSLRRLCFSLHVALIGQTQDRLTATMAGFITATTTTGSDTRLLAVRSRLLWMGLWRQRLVEVWVGYGFFCRSRNMIEDRWHWIFISEWWVLVMVCVEWRKKRKEKKKKVVYVGGGEKRKEKRKKEN